MTDLEKIKLCAEAMDFTLYARGNGRDLEIHHANGSGTIYDPLHNDAQVMALEDWLIERGTLTKNSRYIIFSAESLGWNAWEWKAKTREQRRRAIVECVAKMQGMGEIHD